MKKKFMVIGFYLIISFFKCVNVNASSFNDCGVSNISKAETITCIDIKLTDIDNLENAKKLKYLTLVNVGLNKFPDEILKLKNLKYLNLANNNIKSIPNNIEKIENLEILNLDNNSIGYLNKEISQLSSIKQLYLNSNNINYLPKQINKLDKLKILEIRNNSLNSIIDLNGLKNLEKLDISNNLIINMGDISTTNVYSLDVDNNILEIKKIKSNVKTFNVKNQNKIKFEKKGFKIKVNRLWYNKKNDIINALTINNGKRLVGFKKYDLLLQNSKGDKVKLSDYIDSNNNVRRSGTVYASIRLVANDNSIYQSDEQIVISFLSNPNYNYKSESAIVNSDKDTKLDKGDNLIEKIKDMLSDKSEKNNVSKTLYFEKIKYYIITTILMICISLPVIIFIILIKRAYKSLEEI